MFPLPRTLLTTICLALGLAAWLTLTTPLAADEPAEQEAKIAKLIEQLGGAEFAVREKAQADLAKVGLEAFDALNEAQHHDDVEIALRARYLVRAMQVQWYQDSDPAEVIRILKEYGGQSETERRSRIDRLGTLDERQGLAALCRLARFETSEELSKYAALSVMKMPEIKDAKIRGDVAQKISAGAGSGKRVATAWLRTFAKTLQDPAPTLAAWEAHIKAEHDLFTQSPDRTSREVVRDLYRYEVELLQSLGQEKEAVAVMRRTLSLLEGTPDQIMELVDWLLARKAWPVVQEVAERFPLPFGNNAELIYRLAESQEQEGKKEEAKATAEKARALRPDDVLEHSRLAEVLEKRGLQTWAEREYRHVLAHLSEDSPYQSGIRSRLAEMLHDIGQEKAAGEVLQELVEIVAKNAQAREFAGRSTGALTSRMHYFYSQEHLAKGELEQARKRLEQGVAADPTDADVLIALYRFPDQTEEQKKSVHKLIVDATAVFEKEMEAHRQRIESAPAERLTGDVSYAMACNQYAWLVSNTFGDFDKAVRSSHKSVEMRPEAGGYFDTLGRCYYAKGDLDGAIKYQTLALKLEPHSGQIKRQLEFFQKAKAEKEKGPAANQGEGK